MGLQTTTPIKNATQLKCSSLSALQNEHKKTYLNYVASNWL